MKRDVIIAVTSFAMGVGVSFLVIPKLLEEKYVERAQEESAFNERFAQRLEERERPERPKRQRVVTEETQERDLIGHSSLQGTRTHEYNNEKKNYSRTVRDDIDEPNSDEDDDDEDECDDDDSVDSEYPYVISEISFSEEFLSHDKLSITYYAEDDVLADEQEDMIDDVDALIGYGNLNVGNVGIARPDTIYVRNERIGCDFEITVNYNSYQETVLGIKLDPKQRQENLSRRRNRERNMRDDE
jgi:hypothetical protein